MFSKSTFCSAFKLYVKHYLKGNCTNSMNSLTGKVLMVLSGKYLKHNAWFAETTGWKKSSCCALVQTLSLLDEFQIIKCD